MPAVSVIIPCFNRERLLPETLDSLRMQTFRDWEAIVVDDGSTDQSLSIAQDYAASDARFCVLPRSGGRNGANPCRNKGLAEARSEYIIFLDSDDLLASTCLEERTRRMDREPHYGFGVYLTEIFAERIGDGAVLWNIPNQVADLHRFLSLDPPWHTTGPIWRRAALHQLQGLDEELLSFHDWDLHVRALIAKIPYFKEPVRDNYYRNSKRHQSAINIVSCSAADHLRSHERMFVKTLNQLHRASLFDSETRLRLAGMFWWLAIRWLRIKPPDIREARRAWTKAFNLNLISRRHYVEGLLLLTVYRFKGGGRLATIVQSTWPCQLVQAGSSSTFLKTPVSFVENAIESISA
jgi:glycosyltransferase involved in cell wall biosynthesis